MTINTIPHNSNSAVTQTNNVNNDNTKEKTAENTNYTDSIESTAQDTGCNYCGLGQLMSTIWEGICWFFTGCGFFSSSECESKETGVEKNTNKSEESTVEANKQKVKQSGGHRVIPSPEKKQQ